MPPAEATTRSFPRALLLVAGVLLLLRVASGLYEAHRPPPANLVRWVPIEAAEARAAAEKKPILYDFSAGWCQPCRRMEREVFADGEAAAFINERFIPARVDVDEERESVRSLRRLHNATSIPLVVVVRADNTMERMSGYTNKGGMLSFLRRATAR
jgi:thiol:disulfide interchange protein